LRSNPWGSTCAKKKKKRLGLQNYNQGGNKLKGKQKNILLNKIYDVFCHPTKL